MGILDLGMEGSKHMVFSPGMFPVVSKEVGKACFNAIMSLTSRSWEGAMLCTFWSWKGATDCICSCERATKWSWKSVTGNGLS